MHPPPQIPDIKSVTSCGWVNPSNQVWNLVGMSWLTLLLTLQNNIMSRQSPKLFSPISTGYGRFIVTWANSLSAIHFLLDAHVLSCLKNCKSVLLYPCIYLEKTAVWMTSSCWTSLDSRWDWCISIRHTENLTLAVHWEQNWIQSVVDSIQISVWPGNKKKCSLLMSSHAWARFPSL